jgi:hypothetical protein
MNRIGSRGWQLPYLRVALILRRLTAVPVKADSRRAALSEVRHVEALQRTVARAGWFN